MTHNELILKLKTRKIGTKGELNKFRAQGYIAGVLYGGDKDTVPILVNYSDFIKALHTDMGEHAIFSLEIDGKKTKQSAILKDKHIDPVSRNFLNIDLKRISMKEQIEIDKPSLRKDKIKDVPFN